jgi:hypothetical protein
MVMTTWMVHFTAARLILGQGEEWAVDLPAVKVFGLKLERGVPLLGRLPKGVGIPDHLADVCLIVGLQQAFKGCSTTPHGFHRRMMPIDSLQIGPRATPVFGRGRTLASVTDGIASMRGQRQDRFQTKLALRVINKIVDVTEAMQMPIAPGKDDLQRGVEGGQGHLTADAEAAPD